MKVKLGTKFFLSYLAVLVVGMLVLVIVAQVSLPGAYGSHMGMMAGNGMMGAGQGRGPGAGNGAGTGAGYQSFRSGFYQALGWAGLAALAAAIVVSFFMSRGLAAPLRKMKLASQRMAEGHYSERVPAGGQDELGQLAGSFNVMAEKLEQVEQRRRQLIGDVAHELRTPLTAIKGSMEGLVDGVLPASKPTFEQVAAEADRLSRLVDDLQELSRVEAGEIGLDIGVVSVPEVASSLAKRLSGVYASKSVDLKINLPEELPNVLADGDRLVQVLTNLLTNALRYTPPGGSVTLTAKPRGSEVLVQVIDTGTGIPAEHLPHLFERFYRIDRSRSRQDGSGSGIGLTISKYLVEAQGGRIWAESGGEGRGSTFSFTLPKA